MNWVNMCYVAMIVPSVIAVIYGIAGVAHKHKGLYFTMGVLGVVCLLMGQLAYCASSLVGYAEIRSFHIGSLGAMGSYLFFMTANMGPVNTITDDSHPDKIKFRYLALLGPLAAVMIFAFSVFLMFRMDYYIGLVSGIVLTIISSISIYFSTKMAIIPDVEGGFVDCMRQYNTVVTILSLLNTLERGIRNLWQEDILLIDILYVAMYAIIGITNFAAMVFLKKGAERWENI